MNKREHYQRMAADCLRYAHEARDPTNKALLLEMGQVWGRLAEQAQAADDLPSAASLEGAPSDQPN